jgi:P4 family phage/plasmid primase-like protien
MSEEKMAFDQFKKFVELLTEFDSSPRMFGVQPLHDYEKNKILKTKFYKLEQLEEAYTELRKLNQRGFCCSLALHEMEKDKKDGWVRKNKNCIRPRCFCVDLDYYLSKEAIQSLQDYTQPTAIVFSSKSKHDQRYKAHFYFVLDGSWDNKELLKKYSSYQEALARRIEEYLQGSYSELEGKDITDKKIGDFARAMRAPGFKHQKNRANVFDVTLACSSGPLLTAEGGERLFNKLGIDEEFLKTLGNRDSSTTLPIPAEGELYSGADQGSRNDSLYKQAVRLFYASRHYEEVLASCLYFNRRYHDEPLSESEVEAIVKSAHASGLSEKGQQSVTKEILQGEFQYDRSDETIYLTPTSDEAILDMYMQKHGDKFLSLDERLYTYDENTGVWEKDWRFRSGPAYFDIVDDLARSEEVKRMFRTKEGEFNFVAYQTKITNLKAMSKKKEMQAALVQDERIIRPWGELDSNDFVLNCQNGVLDLETFKLHPHDKKFYCTQQVNAAYPADPDILERYQHLDVSSWPTASLWTRLVWEWMSGSLPMARYLQKIAGYLLEGSNREESLFFLYGTGKNGKSKTVLALQHIMGTYATSVSPALFYNQEEYNNAAMSELAQAVRKRVIFSSETEKNKPWKENFVKNMTGGPGEGISTKMYFQDPKTQPIRFTPIIMGNHHPKINGNDDGIWRRIKLVPYTYIIPEAKRNKKLDQILRQPDVAQDVFAWALAGYRMYQEEGLVPPVEAQEAIQEYRKSMNPIESMLSDIFEECEYKEGIEASELYIYFNHKWRQIEGHDKIDRVQDLTSVLKEMGLQAKQTRSKRHSGARKRLYPFKPKAEWEAEFNEAQGSNILRMAT